MLKDQFPCVYNEVLLAINLKDQPVSTSLYQPACINQPVSTSLYQPACINLKDGLNILTWDKH